MAPFDPHMAWEVLQKSTFDSFQFLQVVGTVFESKRLHFDVERPLKIDAKKC